MFCIASYAIYKYKYNYKYKNKNKYKININYIYKRVQDFDPFPHPDSHLFVIFLRTLWKFCGGLWKSIHHSTRHNLSKDADCHVGQWPPRNDGE